MPAAFDNCIKNGGRVRTIAVSKGRYLHVCWLNGKAYQGEVKKKKKSKAK